MTRFRRSWPWWRWGITGLSTLGLALSITLSWHVLAGRSMIGCGGGSSCDQVLSSRWSAVGGVVPVSGLASGAYLAMLVASLFLGSATEAPVRRLAWSTMLVLSGAAAGSAVWFTIVQKWIIGSFCPYCMATHITGLLLAALVTWHALLPLHNQKSASVLVGLALAGVLAACQIFITGPAVYRGGESQDNLSALDPHADPLLGSPEAPTIITLLFDYNCPHCQQLHFILDEVIRRYHGKLAFVLCPVPLNSQCNPYITRDVDEFKDSCKLAKIALAVWVAKREAFPPFDRWMYSFESGDRWHPRSLDAARAKAVALVGQAKFDAAQTDPWIEKYMKTSIRIYGQTNQSGRDGVPKLVFGSHWVSPKPSSVDDLLTTLHDSLNVPSP